MVTPFVRGITAIFAQAQQEIIGNKDFGQSAAEQRVEDVVGAFQEANQILTQVIPITTST